MPDVRSDGYDAEPDPGQPSTSDWFQLTEGPGVHAESDASNPGFCSRLLLLFCRQTQVLFRHAAAGAPTYPAGRSVRTVHCPQFPLAQ
jgi:hypothetical protein